MRYKLRYYRNLDLSLEQAINERYAGCAEGQIESIEEDGNNTRKLLVKLIVLLAEKEVLKPKDCLALLGSGWSIVGTTDES